MNQLHSPMHRDHAAFLARFNASNRYEKREAPDMADLANAIDGIAKGFKSYNERVDGLRAEVETLQTKLARPGALAGSGPGEDASATTWTVNGKSVQLLRNAADIRTHYAKRSAERSDSSMSGPQIGMADFMRGVAGMGASTETRAILSVGTDADGGHMVPSRLMEGVLSALVPESSLLTAGAGILPLDQADFGAKTFTLAATDTVPTAAWRAENGPVVESSPGFRAVVMTPRSLSFFFKISRELLADAAGIDGTLTLAIAQAFAKELDRAGLRGTGTAPEARGILNTAGIIAVPNGAAGASLATTRYANFFTATQGLLEANGPMPGAAIMSPRSRVILGGLLDTTNQPMQVPDMLRPMRLLHSSQIPNNLTVGASTDCSEIYVGSFDRMVFAMRENMSIQRLNEAYATNGQVAFIAHCRCDFGVMYPKAFAVVTGVRP
jgi:HK97 family phage major capsid protein